MITFVGKFAVYKINENKFISIKQTKLSLLSMDGWKYALSTPNPYQLELVKYSHIIWNTRDTTSEGHPDVR